MKKNLGKKISASERVPISSLMGMVDKLSKKIIKLEKLSKRIWGDFDKEIGKRRKNNG